MGKEKAKSKDRPKYNLWQNSAYMIALAWKVRKSVLFVCLATAGIAVANNLVELFIAPVVLKKVEAAVSFQELVVTIVAFAFVLMVLAALQAYVAQNTRFGRVSVRCRILKLINRKAAITSFPNAENPSTLNMQERATRAASEDYMATGAIWDTLTELCKNIIGFVIYLVLLASLDPVLMTIIVITTVVGYLVNKRIYEWGYRHREEKSGYNRRMTYACQRGGDISLAKDIRIFGMRPWLEEFYQEAMRQFKAFAFRREGVYFRADIVDVVLLLLRNGIAYVYLITMTLQDGLPASTFLLYFSAVNGFTSWVTGILSGFGTLHRQSIEISIVREYLELPEPFLFEGGKPLDKDILGAYEIHLDNVSFRYPGAEKDTLHNLNLTIRPGEKLAVVGEPVIIGLN